MYEQILYFKIRIILWKFVNQIKQQHSFIPRLEYLHKQNLGASTGKFKYFMRINEGWENQKERVFLTMSITGWKNYIHIVISNHKFRPFKLKNVSTVKQPWAPPDHHWKAQLPIFYIFSQKISLKHETLPFIKDDDEKFV